MKRGRIVLYALLALNALAARAIAGAAVPDHVDAGLQQALMSAVRQSASFSNRFAAQVWLLDMSTRLARLVPNVQRRMALLRSVHAEATRAGLDPQLVLAVIQVESRFKRYALSSAGARGLMQIMPFWRHEIGRPDDDLFKIRTNLRYGCTILAYYLRKEQGNMSRALARYNGSLGHYRYPALVEAALRQHWTVAGARMRP